MTVLTRAVFHHLFVVLTEHLPGIIGTEGVLSLDISATTTNRSVNASFWEAKELVTIVVAHFGRDVSDVKSNVTLISFLLSVISMDVTIFNCGCCSSDFIESLDKSPNRKGGVQYPVNLSPVQAEKFMHKPSFSVMGRIDMFSMLRTLLVPLSGLLDESCVR